MQGDTALHLAVLNIHKNGPKIFGSQACAFKGEASLETVAKLIEHGANVNADREVWSDEGIVLSKTRYGRKSMLYNSSNMCATAFL